MKIFISHKFRGVDPLILRGDLEKISDEVIKFENLGRAEDELKKIRILNEENQIKF
jgi:hypothetical protein